MVTYMERVEELRYEFLMDGVPEEEIDEVFRECFIILYERDPPQLRRIFRIGRYITTIIGIILCSSTILYNHPTYHPTVMRNIQDSIYPGLKAFRNLALPAHKIYPSLSVIYDEWCLAENPYFYVDNMDCWPCSGVSFVPDLTGHKINKLFNFGIPYTKIEKSANVTLNDLTELYWEHRSVFISEAYHVISDDYIVQNVQDLMENRKLRLFTTHIKWRITRIRPAQLLRKLFPKFDSVPIWMSQSTEKVIYIDGPNAPSYALQNPECSNVVVRCMTGSRIIKLIPSQECTKNCKPVSVILTGEKTLWYNWWYWRPVSGPVTNQSSLSITYLNSFC